MPRADPQCNRERILEIAKEAFTRSGANIDLDEVARQAGVEVNPVSRLSDARYLLEAVYRSEWKSGRAAERKCAETTPTSRRVARLDVALR
jgi:hypothetical protein